MFESEWDAGLDDAQLAAVAHGDGPLVDRGRRRHRQDPHADRAGRAAAGPRRPTRARVLLLTFTRRAAADMLARAAILCGDRRVTGRLWGGTFHAVAHRLITLHADALGLAPESDGARSGRRRRTDGPAAARPRPGRHERNGSRARTRCVDVYSRAVNTGRPAREVIAAEFPWCDRHTRRDPRPVPRLRGPQTGRRAARLRRPAARLAGAAAPTRRSAR